MNADLTVLKTVKMFKHFHNINGLEQSVKRFRKYGGARYARPSLILGFFEPTERVLHYTLLWKEVQVAEGPPVQQEQVCLLMGCDAMTPSLCARTLNPIKSEF
jgi:hypothetical protein